MVCLSFLIGRQRPGRHQIFLKRFYLRISPTPRSFQCVYQFRNYPISEFVKSAVLPSWFTFDSISAIKFVKWVVPSPCETRPNHNKGNKMNKDKTTTTNLAAVSESIFWRCTRPSANIHSSVTLIKELPRSLVS